jgi:NAD(P)H-hydrate epimerase
VCGKGNNGGDGFVVARLALAAGYETRVVLVADPDTITGDAALFMHVLAKLGCEIVAVQQPGEITAAMRSLQGWAVIVDALLGTGIQGEVHGSICHAVNEWPDVPTIAVDIPSGMDADTGEPCGCCVTAQTTVTLQCAKTGFENPEAKPYLGRLVVADIGIPEICTDDEAWHARMT